MRSLVCDKDMIKKHDNVRIKTIVLDLHDVFVDSKKVALFEYE